MNKLQRRIVDLSYKYKSSHLSSCLTAVNIIDGIYQTKGKDEPFILSNGHAGLALYVVLEKYEGQDAEKLWLKHGVHPNRDKVDGIWCSTGSLGQGISVAVGMALADRTRGVFCLLSDGECAEGQVWEALKIAGDLRLENLRVAVNANGHSAYNAVDVDTLDTRLQMFFPSLVVKTNLYDFPDWLQGVNGHYQIMDKTQYEEIIR